jgi:DNA topoisomerase I
VIPPAWQEVWICPRPNGHIQACGTDAAGRRQYLYHPVWREKRDRAKFDRVLEMAKRLPTARARMLADLAVEGMPKDRVLAAAVRLIDIGYFRIGSDVYADEHGSYGLTTLERRHVRRRGEALVFSFIGKSGIEHSITVDDPAVVDIVERLRRRKGGGERLLAYKSRGRWLPVNASDVNDYLGEIFEDCDVTAKDFRTWHATVIAAASLAENPGRSDTPTARKKVIRQAVVEVSEYLGNTPAIAKSSYIDPRVIDLYEDGTTIAPVLERTPSDPVERQDLLEKAVLALLSEAPESALRAVRTRIPRQQRPGRRSGRPPAPARRTSARLQRQRPASSPIAS